MKNIIILLFSVQVAYADLPIPTSGEFSKFYLSKLLQMYGPKNVAKIVSELDRVVKEKYPEHYDAYSKHKERVYQATGHFSWKLFCDFPFLGLNAINFPGLIAYTAAQVMAHHVIPEKMGLEELVQSKLPEWIQTWGVNLKTTTDQNAQLNAYISTSGKLVVVESQWSPVKGFIKRVDYRNENGKQHVDIFWESSQVTISLKPDNALPFKDRFSISENSSIIDTFVNTNGEKTVWASGYPYRWFHETGDGNTHDVSAAKALSKATTVLMATLFAWPMYDVGTRLWETGVLNLAPFTNYSYLTLTAFTLGGYFGTAIGNNLSDVMALGAYHAVHKTQLAPSCPDYLIPTEVKKELATYNPKMHPSTLGSILDKSRVYRVVKMGVITAMVGGLLSMTAPQFYANHIQSHLQAAANSSAQSFYSVEQNVHKEHEAPLSTDKSFQLAANLPNEDRTPTLFAKEFRMQVNTIFKEYALTPEAKKNLLFLCSLMGISVKQKPNETHDKID